MTRTAVSLFAGVGGFDLALERAGVKVVAAVEIDKHARGILSQRFTDSKLFEDVRKVTGDELRAAGFISDGGIITGGFPCQDLSVAGKRAGFTGKRSSLFYEIARIADETQAEWLVLENVPGLLTSQRGADMGAVIGTLADLGYVGSWRVLDAQHFGVPQRRRRVFIVARRAGDPTSCAEILFEPTSLRGNPASSRASGQETTGGAGEGAEIAGALTANEFKCDLNKAQSGHLTIGFSHKQGLDAQPSTNLFPTLRAGGGGHAVMEPEPVIVGPLTALGMANAKGTETTDSHHYVLEPTLNQFDQGDSRTVVAIVEPYQKVVGTIAAGAHPGSYNGQDAYNDMFIVEPIAVQGSVIGRSDAAGPGGKGHGEEGDPMFTLNTTDRHAVAYPIQDGREIEKSQNGIGVGDEGNPAYTIDTTGAQSVATGTVRRLTPTECERLQGFPDGWTEGQADSHRYKQMGNAVAVPVVEWIINRLVEWVG